MCFMTSDLIFGSWRYKPSNVSFNLLLSHLFNRVPTSKSLRTANKTQTTAESPVKETAPCNTNVYQSRAVYAARILKLSEFSEEIMNWFS